VPFVPCVTNKPVVVELLDVVLGKFTSMPANGSHLPNERLEKVLQVPDDELPTADSSVAAETAEGILVLVPAESNVTGLELVVTELFGLAM